MQVCVFNQPLMKFIYSRFLREVLEDRVVVRSTYRLIQLSPKLYRFAQPSQEVAEI